MKPIEVLTAAFKDGCSDKQLRRLMDYADSGKPFLCGEDAELFCRDKLG